MHYTNRYLMNIKIKKQNACHFLQAIHICKPSNGLRHAADVIRGAFACLRRRFHHELTCVISQVLRLSIAAH